MYDLVGKTFGNLKVLEKTTLRKGRGHVVWRCSCSCGRDDYLVTTDHLVRRKNPVRSCGCRSASEEVGLRVSEVLAKRGFVGVSNPNWKGYKGFPLGLYTHLVKNAMRNPRREMKFELTIEQLWDLFEAQGRKCVLTGIELRMMPRKNANVSLDRIDSSKDYVVGNVQWVHKDVNIMKNMYPMEYFICFCNLVANVHERNVKEVPNTKIAFGRNKG